MAARFKMRPKAWCVFSAAMIFFSSPAFALEEVTLQLRWLHQFQFAGYYAAKEKGFYQDAGIDVRINAGEAGKVAIDEVLSERAQYGVGNHEVLLNRLHGKPVVALAAIFQHSPQVFLSLKDSGINTPHDLVHRKVMTIGGKPDAALVAMLSSESIDPNLIEVVKSSFNINDLVDGNTDVFNSYLTNEPFFLKQKGIPYTILNPTQYGIDFYSDILFTTEGEIEDNPDRVKRFRDASLRGWLYAMDNPEEIIDIILNKYSSAKSREHLRFEANAMRPLIMPKFVDMGHINPLRWQIMIKAFMEVGLIVDASNLEGLVYDPILLAQKRQAFFMNMLLIVFAVAVVGGSLLWNIVLRRTVHKRTRELRKIEKSLSNAQRIAHIGNWEWDIQTNKLWQSEEAFRIFGLEPRNVSLTYESLLDLVHPEDRAGVQEAVNAALDGAAAYDIEHRIIRPDDSVCHVHEQGEVTLNDDGRPCFMHGTIQDITEAKESQANLMLISKLASLGEMATGTAHEINQPLNVIRMASDSLTEMLEGGVAPSPDVLKTKLERISSQISRATGIINRMRVFGRSPLENATKISPKDAVLGASGLLSEELRLSDIELKLDIPETCRLVMGDLIQFEQVVLNLLSNARDAIEGDIETADKGEASGCITVTVKDDPATSFIKVIVQDTGGGIPVDVLPKIFIPFLTTKEVGKGIGLGLSISYGIVTEMGGTIKAENKNDGAVFTISLPVVYGELDQA